MKINISEVLSTGMQLLILPCSLGSCSTEQGPCTTVYRKEGNKSLFLNTETWHHEPNYYKDTKPLMSYLLVFNKVYRLEYTLSRVGIFDPYCELAPL
jgi:hypothetical protein